MHLQPQFQTEFPRVAAPPVRALLLDDSSFDRARIRRLSREAEFAIELDEVGSIAEMETAVGAAAYDLILVDYRLPVGDGIQALEAIRDTALNRSAGTIMITGNAELDTAVTAMRRGCHDFLSKDGMTAEMLQTAMRNAMMAAERSRQLALANEAVHAQIRDSVVVALSDKSMQETMMSILHGHLRNASVRPFRSGPEEESQELLVLLQGLLQDDEFIFH